MSRVLHRPKHGWATTKGERIDAALAGFWPLLMFSCIVCIMGISVFGATIETINQLIIATQ